jgi:glycosyltransferase involved in cell wall biosynthesis
MIRHLSFIVIARNEAFAIDKCLASIAAMPMTECEVICVDSASTDDTLEYEKLYW